MKSTATTRLAGTLRCRIWSTLRRIGTLIAKPSQPASLSPAHLRLHSRFTEQPAAATGAWGFVLPSLLLLGLLLAASAAHATSGYLSTWQGIYPGSASDNNASCQLCHGQSTQNINPYGLALAACNGATGGIAQRIAAVEAVNSDGDAGGFTNLQEINANTQPGWTTGAVPVWGRNNCVSSGTNTYPGSGAVDPAAPNTPPVANNDSYSTAFQTQLVVPAPGVLGNDTDANGDPLTAVLQSGPTSGTLNLSSNGSFTYTPAAGFSGNASFTYAANDGTVNGNTATVTITVGNPPNVPPVANNDSYTTAFQTPLTVPAPGVLGNDTDANGDPLTAVLLTGVTSGTLNLAANGSFTYTPAAGFTGTASFTYRANDGTAFSNSATVTITVGNPPNVPPVANNDSYTTAFQTPLTVPAPGVLGNDTDANGDPLTAILQSGPTSGTLALNANGSFTYTPAAGFSGNASFTYAANDGTVNGNTATVTITVGSPANAPPVANNDSYSTAFQTQLIVPAPGVLGNDTDADGDTLTAVQQSGPTSGTLNLNVDGSFTYTPATGFSGPVTFTYVANDGTDNSNVATVTVTVQPAAGGDADLDGIPDNQDNCTDVANGTLIPDAGGNSQLDTDGDGFGNVCDADFNNDCVVDAFDLPAFRTAFGSAGPEEDLNGDGVVDAFDIPLLRTGFGQPPGPSFVGACVPGGGAAPTARGDSYTTVRNQPLTVPATRLSGVLYNDFDGQNDPLTAVSLNTTGTQGSVTLNADGSFTYTPPAGAPLGGAAYLDDTFTYQASDGTNLSTVATVNVRVLPKQTDFKFMMNYELGMHCTGFEFAYCCVLPAYNSIVRRSPSRRSAIQRRS